MNFKNLKLGAEPKKLAILVALLVVAGLVFIFNSADTPEESASVSPPAGPAAAPAVANRPAPALATAPATAPARAARLAARRESREFRPSVGPRRGEQRIDPMQIDPTLRLDLLAKLQDVKVEGPHRSVFDFGQAPAPKVEPVKLPLKPAPSPFVGPMPVAKVEPPKPPPPPPIPLKFYGYASPVQNNKRAFFMEGDEIYIASEGELVKRRYKVVRIGVNSAVLADTQFEDHQQTLPLEEQPGT